MAIVLLSLLAATGWGLLLAFYFKGKRDAARLQGTRASMKTEMTRSSGEL